MTWHLHPPGAHGTVEKESTDIRVLAQQSVVVGGEGLGAVDDGSEPGMVVTNAITLFNYFITLQEAHWTASPVRQYL